ncbi:MAG TPA: PQQ-binding-like beta-propeller repeat protein [Acidobacteriota bacterium]|nr:PQQ-binding-like beta-propeller repeat protein [Acidobacteriota bacterium]
MTNGAIEEPVHQKSLRLWPGVAAIALQWLAWFGSAVVATGMTAAYIGVLGAFFCALIVVAWWLFFSRAPWPDRLLGVALMVVFMMVTPYFLHNSITGMGMGMMFYIFSIPFLCLALVVAAALGRGLSAAPRRLVIVAAFVLVGMGWSVLRSDGIRGDGTSQFAFRWTDTPEERLLAQAGERPSDFAAPPDTLEGPAQWPGFRGPKRDGISRGVHIETDWTASPPVELWRRQVGPGWSSFAVAGDVFYTQEQRGEHEVVACYKTASGQPVWVHRDPTRFWEANAGAGPRGTPTLAEGRVYTLGATGIVNALEAADGSVVWSRNAAEDTGQEVPYWGFAGSPLVVEDIVIVALAGQLAAYDRESGMKRWVGPKGGAGYSSPHFSTIDGVAQVLLSRGAGVLSVAPQNGMLLWEHSWRGDGIVQPAVTAEGDVLLGSGSGVDGEVGMRRLAVALDGGAWTVSERWTSRGLKPYFNGFVVHRGHAFGFDGRILSCIDLEDGKRRWKGGRYGHGQLVLLPDQDLLFVLSEDGDLALVSATPDEFHEVGRVPAIEGKTWNHPVVVDDLVLVRNAREMAGFRISTKAAANH